MEEVPETGAVFTFGKSRFGDDNANKFWVKNDPVIAVACGDEHTAVVTSTGRYIFFCWVFSLISTPLLLDVAFLIYIRTTFNISTRNICVQICRLNIFPSNMLQGGPTLLEVTNGDS